MTGERKPYEAKAVAAFLSHCDEFRLTHEEGLVLAERVAEAVQSAAEDRDPGPPEAT